MKETKYRWHGSALCLALTLLAAGCGMSNDLECPSGSGTSGSGTAFMQLSFGIANTQGTRTTPTGGEDGDGNEAGQPDENAVSNAVAFLFDGNVTVNGAATTPVTPVYFSTVTPKQTSSAQGVDAVYTTAPVQTTLENGTYNVIVVANPGDDKWWDQSANQTLGQVRDHIQKAAWKEGDNGTYSDFLMSLADEVTQKLVIKNNPEDDPATTTVNVERMAARVDYIDGRQDKECTDPRYQGATVEITGATIINRLTAGSYLLKRVAEDVNGKTPDYLGKETSNNDKATNYVLDPWTAQKTQANLEGTPFTIDGQNVAASDLYDPQTYIPTRSDNPEEWAEYCHEGTKATADNYLRVGYALENTTDKLSTSLNYNTGIVFKAQFHPKDKDVEGYTDGHTFFTYNGTIYPTLTSMMGQLNAQKDFAAYASEELKKLASWEELTNFAQSFVNDPTGYRDYLTKFATEHSSETYNANAEQLTWTYYLNQKLGVEEDAQNGPQINQNNVETRAALYDSSEGLLRTYYNGQCYYIWWLRHSNDGDEETNGMMEYAIVRNNIYKVNVESIYSLGGDIPDNEQLDAMVYVNKWSMLPPEVLPM